MRIAHELADLAAQEQRAAEAQLRAEAEEAEFLQKAAEEKAEQERRRQVQTSLTRCSTFSVDYYFNLNVTWGWNARNAAKNASKRRR